MAVNLSPVGGVAAQFFDNAGNVLTGGKLYTYAAGTTTPQIAYTTSAGNVPWSNPIILDAAGRVSGSGEIWLVDASQYKFILRDSNDVLIATYDNINGINSNFVNFTNEQEIQTATAGQTVFNLTTTTYSPGTNSLSVFVDGVNQYGPGAQYAYLETDSDTVTFVNGLHVGALVKFTTSQLNSSGAVDASQVSYDPPFANSAPTNVEAKLAQTVSVKDFGAVGDDVVDDTAAIQNALDSANSVIFPPGEYRINGDIFPNDNQYITVEAGAIVNCYGGRITSYGVSNVTIEINGIINSIGLAIDTGNLWNLFYTGYAERGFIEFGGIYPAVGSGYKVFGSGKVVGDYSGGPVSWPAQADLINLKGIAIWQSSGEVSITDIELTGFKGEAIYFRGPQDYVGTSANILFQNLHVYDVGFNALNFNIAVTVDNAVISNCTVDGTCYQCVEISSGSLIGCNLRGSEATPVQLGAGVVKDVWIENNIIYGGSSSSSATITALAASTNPRLYTVNIINNQIFDSLYIPVIVQYMGRVNFTGNTVINYPAGSYGIVVYDTTVDYATITNNLFIGQDVKSVSITDNTLNLVKDNAITNPVTGGYVDLKSGPYTVMETSKFDYSTANVVSSLPLSFGSYYQITPDSESPSASIAAGAPFAKVYATAYDVNVGYTTALGKYTIATRRANTTVTGDVGDTIDFYNDGTVAPSTDNTQLLGSAIKRWSVVYAGTGTINTSDEREKQDIKDLSETEKQVAIAIKGLIKSFRFKDAVVKKGDKARIHFGVTAQQVAEAFKIVGLNPDDYAMFCYDEWETSDGVEAGNRYGIRYDELLAFVISAL